MPRVGGAQDRRFHSVFQDLATVRLIDAGKDLHQRALAGPVLASKRMHQARAKAEINVAENLDWPEAFGNAAKLYYRGAKLQLKLISVRFHARVTPLSS